MFFLFLYRGRALVSFLISKSLVQSSVYFWSTVKLLGDAERFSRNTHELRWFQLKHIELSLFSKGQTKWHLKQAEVAFERHVVCMFVCMFKKGRDRFGEASFAGAQSFILLSLSQYVVKTWLWACPGLYLSPLSIFHVILWFHYAPHAPNKSLTLRHLPETNSELYLALIKFSYLSAPPHP